MPSAFTRKPGRSAAPKPSPSRAEGARGGDRRHNNKPMVEDQGFADARRPPLMCAAARQRRCREGRIDTVGDGGDDQPLVETRCDPIGRRHRHRSGRARGRTAMFGPTTIGEGEGCTDENRPTSAQRASMLSFRDATLGAEVDGRLADVAHSAHRDLIARRHSHAGTIPHADAQGCCPGRSRGR